MGTSPNVVVTWTAPGSATVELRGEPSATRTLSFREEDPALDAWRSVGLVVAALMSRPPPEAAPESKPSPPVRRTRPLPLLWMDGGTLLGSGLRDGPLSFGGTLRVGYELPIPVFVGAGVSYTSAGRGPQGLEGSWTSFVASAGTVLAFSEVAVRPRLELLATRLVAEANDGPRAGSGSRFVGGSGAGVEVSWPAADRFSLVVGADGAFYTGATAIHLGDARVSAFPALDYRFFLGVQVALLPGSL